MHVAHIDLTFESIERSRRARQDAEAVPSHAKDPLEMLIELEEEMGCSVIEAVKRYRDLMREARTVDAH